MTIRKFSFTILISSLIVLLAILAATYLLISYYGKISEAEKYSRTISSNIYTCNASVLRSKTLLKDYIINRDDAYFALNDSLNAKINNELNSLATKIEDETIYQFPIFIKNEFNNYRNIVLSLNRKNRIYLHEASQLAVTDYQNRVLIYNKYTENIQPDFTDFIERSSINALKIMSSYFQVQITTLKNKILFLLNIIKILVSFQILLLLGYTVYIFKLIILPIRELINAALIVSNGNYEIQEIKYKNKNEIGTYLEFFNRLVQNLKSASLLNDSQKWLRNNENHLYHQIIDIYEVDKFYNTLLAEICKIVNANSAILYSYISSDKLLTLSAAYAAPANRTIKQDIPIGEGIIGEYALKNELVIIKDLPANYYEINSSLGSVKPAEIAFMPIKYDFELLGIIEIASLNGFSSLEEEFLQLSRRIIASSLNNLKNHLKQINS